MGAFALASLVKRGEVKPSEIMDAYLRRIDEFNPAINAITDLRADRARELALEADKNCGTLNAGLLGGVPFTVKSSIAAKGFRHECGTPLRANQTAGEDARIVSDVKECGAIVVGTTNVPEMLMAYETDNSLYGRTNSPLDLSFTPGGSSGGCAAAVAAGFSAASFGSDAGGSVRVPAHFCGLYGLKPSPGLIPRTGHWPPIGGPATTLAAVGPITRTAEDLLNLFHCTAWEVHDDTDIGNWPHKRWLMHDRDVLRGCRVGWFDHAWDTPVTAETRAAIQIAKEALTDWGMKLERVELRGLEQAPRVWWQQFGICLRTLIENGLPPGYRLHPLAYDAMASDEELQCFTHEDLLAGWVMQDQMRQQLQQQMNSPYYAALLCPVAAIPAFRHGERSWNIDGQVVKYPDAFVYSQVFNLLPHPAATVPVSKTADGRPIGVQLVGQRFDDPFLLEVVGALEEGLGRDPQQAPLLGPA